jgi:hypothetical protein
MERSVSRALSIAVFLSLTGPAWSQPQQLLFTTLSGGERLCNPYSGRLTQLDANEVAIVTPGPMPAPAFKYAPHLAWTTLVGDEDGDLDYIEDNLFGKIDAIQNGSASHMRGLWFSVSRDIGNAVSGVTVRPADIVRIRGNGQPEAMLTAEQIVNAFGINPALVPTLDVDAFAVGYLQVGAPPAILLSFEEDVAINTAQTGGPLVVRDGAVLEIPWFSINWNANGTVQGTAAQSGRIVLMESGALSVDSMVDNSQIVDNAGNHPTTIGDTDGLEMDPAFGQFLAASGIWYLNFFICGETLTGGGVISTDAFGGVPGSVARLNGAPLADIAGGTTGARVGLCTNPAGSLNGLALAGPGTYHYVTDSDHPRPFLANRVQVRIGGGAPGVHQLYLWLYVWTAANLPGQVAGSVLVPGAVGFPDFYGTIPPSPAFNVNVNANGEGLFEIPWNLPPLGFELIVQAANVGANVQLSTPITLKL